MVGSTFVGIIILMSLALLSALFSIELKNLILSLISLILMNFFVWGAFLIFKAQLVAWVQLIIYGGGFTALFLVVVALTEKQTDDYFDWKRTIIGAGLVAALVGVTIWILAYVNLFHGPTFETIDGGFIASYLTELWTNRATDVVLQALIFLATGIAISMLFLQHKKSKKTEEEVKA